MNGDAHLEEVTAKEAYPALVQLVIHAESITWNRFYNFLMGNSILVLAWATIFVSPASAKTEAKAVLAAICLLGAASGIAWAALAVRGRRFLFDFVTLGQMLETGQPNWASSLKAVKPLSKAADLRDNQAFRWAGSLYLLVLGSLAFSVLYSVMLIASVGWSWAAVPLVITLISIGWFWVAFRTALRSPATQASEGRLTGAAPVGAAEGSAIRQTDERRRG
jgi:hypothetical protein